MIMKKMLRVLRYLPGLGGECLACCVGFFFFSFLFSTSLFLSFFPPSTCLSAVSEAKIKERKGKGVEGNVTEFLRSLLLLLFLLLLIFSSSFFAGGASAGGTGNRERVRRELNGRGIAMGLILCAVQVLCTKGGRRRAPDKNLLVLSCLVLSG